MAFPRLLCILSALIASAVPVHSAAQQADVAGMGYDRGVASAPIQVVEFGDFGCSACARFEAETSADFHREFVATGRIRFKYIPFVMGNFPNSEEATRAALCAGDQSSYWPMHDLLFERQREWVRLRDPQQLFEELAAALRLNAAAFGSCYSSEATQARVNEINRTAHGLRLRGTPTFFINGREALGAIPIEQWRQIVAVLTGGTPD